MNDNLILKTEDIESAYIKKKILFGVSIEIKNGEIVSIIGPNGAGKSTLFKTIVGILKPLNGCVIYNGKDITGRSLYENVKEGIGYLIQGRPVFTNLTVLENIELSAEVSLNGENKKRIKEMFNLFPELEKYKNRRAGLLSGGEQKMLSLAILLVQNPKVLLLDEPSLGLSPILAKRITEKIKKINKQFSIPVILIEQNIPNALSISDRVYLLRLGKCIFSGTPKQIIENKILQDEYFK